MISVTCPSCRKALKVPGQHAGKTGKCPQCRTAIKIPQANAPVDPVDKTPSKADAPPQAPPKPTKAEVDNMGTRQDTAQKANTYWNIRQMKPQKEPYLLYWFPGEKSARAALLELPCIHIAKDTNKLICTEVLTYGYYCTDDTGEGSFEAIVAGMELDTELFETARNSFRKHGGKPCGDGELAPAATAPTRRKPATDKKPPPKSLWARMLGLFRSGSASAAGTAKSNVKFVKKYTQPNRLGTNCTYEIYRAPDAESAKDFLQGKPTPKPLYYLVVETPHGNYGRDKDGIYKE